MDRRTWLAVGVMATAIIGTAADVPDASARVATGPARSSERALQRLEERILGPVHAREHRDARTKGRRQGAARKKRSPVQRRYQRRYLARLTAAGDPATEGRWTSDFEAPVVGVHSAVLPTGKVMLFSQRVHDYRNRVAAAYLWDPSKDPGQAGEFKAVPPGDNIWCGGQSLMADGQLLVTGGNLEYATKTSGFKGLKSVFTFDPWSETWTRQPDMAQGRWYPTQTLLPDGRTLITSGYSDVGEYEWNTDIDVFNPPTVRGGQGSITRIARYGELPGAPHLPHWYPHWFVMPSGGVLNAGFKRTESWLLDTTPGAVRGTDRPNWSMSRKYGSAVLLPGTPTGSTRVMQLGGYNASTGGASVATTEIYDEATPDLAPRPGPVMQVPRTNQNTVLLPDRSIVNVGGGSGEVDGTESPTNANTALAAAEARHRQVEILDPGSDTWRLGPPQRHKRSYHSTAVLLPDGRVLSAGDDRDPDRGADYQEKDQAEIYEPSYLHKPGTRPRIVRAPEGIAFGEQFAVTTDAAVSSAVLMAPGATTHANDMHQRLVTLSMTPSADGTGATVVAPANANIAPPGYYMLFVLGPNGKPSVAKWIYVGQSREASAPAPTVGSPDPAPSESPGGAPVSPHVPSSPPVSAPARPESPSSDVSSPRSSVRIVSSHGDLRRRGRLVVKTRMSEAGRARLSVVVRNRRSTAVRLPRRGTTSVYFTRPATKSRTLRLSRVQRRRLGRGTLRVTITLRAGDEAGNRVTRTSVFTLRP